MRSLWRAAINIANNALINIATSASQSQVATKDSQTIGDKELVMSPHRIGYLTILLAAIGTATAASAQSTTTTTTTIEKRSEPLRLTPQQRTAIYRTVTRERRVVPPADIQVRMGAVVPPAIVLSPSPESIYVKVPALTQYKYFYVNNQLVLVDPTTSEVIDIIDQ